jgi:hypothetical protein
MLFLISYMVFSTKFENKRVGQVLPGGEEGGGSAPNNVYTCK